MLVIYCISLGTCLGMETRSQELKRAPKRKLEYESAPEIQVPSQEDAHLKKAWSKSIASYSQAPKTDYDTEPDTSPKKTLIKKIYKHIDSDPVVTQILNTTSVPAMVGYAPLGKSEMQARVVEALKGKWLPDINLKTHFITISIPEGVYEIKLNAQHHKIEISKWGMVSGPVSTIAHSPELEKAQLQINITKMNPKMRFSPIDITYSE